MQKHIHNRGFFSFLFLSCNLCVFITLSYQLSCGVVHPCGCNFPFLLILTATHDHGTEKTRQIGYAAQALVANQSTIIFEPHSEKQSSPRTLLTVLGLGGLSGKKPPSFVLPHAFQPWLHSEFDRFLRYFI